MKRIGTTPYGFCGWLVAAGCTAVVVASCSADALPEAMEQQPGLLEPSHHDTTDRNGDLAAQTIESDLVSECNFSYGSGSLTGDLGNNEWSPWWSPDYYPLSCSHGKVIVGLAIQWTQSGNFAATSMKVICGLITTDGNGTMSTTSTDGVIAGSNCGAAAQWSADTLCPSGQVVVGIEGANVPNPARSFTSVSLMCKAIDSAGIPYGPATTVPVDNPFNANPVNPLSMTCATGKVASSFTALTTCVLDGFYFYCATPTVVCHACGDGILTPGYEGCDDGNTIDGDGCNANCRVELGQTCSGSTQCASGFCVGGVCCESACSSSDCMTATCQAGTGVCSMTALSDGTACNDNNASTHSDACQAGTCIGIAAFCGDGILTPSLESCDDGNTIDGDGCNANCRLELGQACNGYSQCASGHCIDGVCCESACYYDWECQTRTCQAGTGSCIITNRPNGSYCNDYNGCTESDSCQAGACTGTPKVCDSEPCLTTGTCVPYGWGSYCSYQALPDGTACDDGNACKIADSCQSGSCTGTPITCPAPDQCHKLGTCDPATGICSNPAKADGSPCSDGNACTVADSCQAGTCIPGPPIVCAAQDQCHSDGACDPDTGICFNPAKADSSPCTDGNACTIADSCQAGTCLGGPAVVCTALDSCHSAGACNPATGICSNPLKANGTSCDDGDACTQADSCLAGTCIAGKPVTCTALDSCHEMGTCDPATGICNNPAKADGSSCDDGNACTQVDVCQGGTCIAGTPVQCAALDACHDVGTCDSATGICNDPVKPDGSPCFGGSCSQGTCVADIQPPTTCTNTSDCPSELQCVNGQCQATTDDSNSGCSCSTPGDTSSGSSTTILAVALSAFLTRRRRAFAPRSC